MKKKKVKQHPVDEINSLRERIKKLEALSGPPKDKDKKTEGFNQILESRVASRTFAERFVQKLLRNEIEDRKQIEQVIRQALEYANGIIDTIRDPLIILDGDLKVISASRSFYRTFKVKLENTEEKHIYDLGDGQWNIPKLRELLENIMANNISFDDFEVEHDFLNIGRRIMVLNARKIESKPLQTQLILLAFEDITEQKKAEKELKALSDRKSAFVGHVSHEFRNPMTIIRESLAQLLDGLAGEINPKQKHILERGINTVDRLIRLINNILDISKIEAGKMELKRENFDIGLLIAEILANYEGEIVKKQILFKKDIGQDLGALWADRDMITEVMINLLANAIKYTSEKGKVGIRISGDKDEVRFEISNGGPGIREEYLTKIFDKFESITAEKQEGTGLGLPIAKDIVELHKGRIWVDGGVDKETKFIFVLPRDLRK